MIKIWSIAWNDYLLTVISRTFLISLLLAPLLFLGISGIQLIARSNKDLQDKVLVVVDRSNVLYPAIAEKAVKRNRSGKVLSGDLGKKKKVGSRFLIEPYGNDFAMVDKIEKDLSEKIRNKEIFAFALIGKDVVHPGEGSDNRISYYSDSPTTYDLPDWLSEAANEKVESLRFESAGIHQRTVNKLLQPVSLDRLGLADASKEGLKSLAQKEDMVEAFIVPLGAVFLLFIIVNMSAPLMLNMVIEEKMNKIMEVLISSVPPFHLMLGKLLAATMVGLTLATVYLGSMIALFLTFGDGDAIPGRLCLWFILFLILALMSYGSIWGSIGAACSEIKDTQNFAGLTVIMVIAPFALVIPVLESPGSAFSIGISLVPLFTPMLMLLRLGIPPGPAPWEIGLSLVLCVAFTLLCVWGSGKIFRFGLLAQGHRPNLGQVIRWLFSS